MASLMTLGRIQRLRHFAPGKAYCSGYAQVVAAGGAASGHGMFPEPHSACAPACARPRRVSGRTRKRHRRQRWAPCPGVPGLFVMHRTSRADEKGLCFGKSLVRGTWGAIRWRNRYVGWRMRAL